MQIIFTCNQDFLGKLIRWFTKISWVKQGRVSHVALRFGRNEDNWMVESNSQGFVPNWWTYFEKRNKIFAKFEIFGIDEDVLEKIVDKQIDKTVHSKYDYGNLLGFAFLILFYKLTGKLKRNIFAWPKHFICSEIIYKIFKEVEKQTNIKFFEQHNDETIFPEELLIDCEKNKNLFKKLI